MESITTISPFEMSSESTGVTAGPGLSLTDLGRFEHAIYSAQARLDTVAVTGPGAVERAAAAGFEGTNRPWDELAEASERLLAKGREVSAIDLANFQLRTMVFSIQSQFTSTVCNRTSDGVSQLFKQQS